MVAQRPLSSYRSWVTSQLSWRGGAKPVERKEKEKRKKESIKAIAKCEYECTYRYKIRNGHLIMTDIVYAYIIG